MQNELSYKIEAVETLRLFSLYTDRAGAENAKCVVNAISKLAGTDWQCLSEMWKVEALTASELMKRMLAADAANSQVLIVAAGSLEHRPSLLVKWLESLAEMQPVTSCPSLLIALLGDADGQSQELDWTVRELLRCGRAINRDVIWQWMGPDSSGSFDWLDEYVEPLLKRKFLSLQQPAIDLCGGV